MAKKGISGCSAPQAISSASRRTQKSSTAASQQRPSMKLNVMQCIPVSANSSKGVAALLECIPAGSDARKRVVLFLKSAIVRLEQDASMTGRLLGAFRKNVQDPGSIFQEMYAEQFTHVGLSPAVGNRFMAEMDDYILRSGGGRNFGGSSIAFGKDLKRVFVLYSILKEKEEEAIMAVVAAAALPRKAKLYLRLYT